MALGATGCADATHECIGLVCFSLHVMSRRHIDKSRECGRLHVLAEDQIWETANDVWNINPFLDKGAFWGPF